MIALRSPTVVVRSDSGSADFDAGFEMSFTNKIAVFIDGANIYATTKALGFEIDYRQLLLELQSHGNLVRAFYYTTIIEDQEYSSVRPLVDWLDYNGYTVMTKPTKEFSDESGRRIGGRGSHE